MHVLELDYVQSVILRQLYTRYEGIAFKGGTSLRMAHGLNRFSEDLDFNIMEGDPKRILETAVKGLERTGIPARIGNFLDRKNVYLASIRYQGPLYSGNPLSEGTLELEFSKYRVKLDPVWSTILSPYPDVGTFMLWSMAPDEILAEKLRSLKQRRKPRDLYDIWYLLNKGAVVRKELVYEKMKEVGLDPIDPLEVLDGYDIDQKEWERDMGNLMTRVPDLDSIMKNVRGPGGIE
jgi:predicted nucleotidyltransferase component of viral defense system